MCRALTNIGRKIVLLSYPTDLLNEQEEEKLFNFLRSSVQKNQVILVGCRRLLTSTFADCIVALSDHDGSVLQQGEASDLQTKAGPFKQELQKYVIAEENEWGEAGLAQTELDEIIETRGPQDFDPFPKNLQYEQTVDRMYSAGLDAYPNHNTD